MRYIYFTKMLQGDLKAIMVFLKDAGLDGADLAVRPGYPVHPGNALAELPKAAKAFADEGLTIGLVSAPTDLVDPESAAARTLFEAAGKAGVPAIKLGYFPYRGNFDAGLADTRRKLARFAKLAVKTGVRACYHTHSGSLYGNNGPALRLLLQDLDPHQVGAFLDTGHIALGGGPIRMEIDTVRPWFSLLAIKDIVWDRQKSGWRSRVAPAGEGIVHWNEVAQGLKECRFNGTISLHGEYETKDLDERRRLAKEELAFLKKQLA